MRLIRYFTLLLVLAVSACVYRPDIKQGNFIKPSMVRQLKSGMTEAQVQFIMGTPMIQDPFHANRWYYVYYNVPSSLSARSRVSERRVVVVFRNGKLTRVRSSANATQKDG